MFAHFRFMDRPGEVSGKSRMSEMSFLARAIGLATVATVALGAMSAAQAAEPLFGRGGDPATSSLFGGPPAMAPSSSFGAPPEETPVTFATNWYLRGDLGVSQDVQIGIGSATLPRGGGFPNGWSFGLGAGYKFNEWMRADMTLDWRAPRTFNSNTASITCTTGWAPIKDAAGNIIGETPITDTCKDLYRARLNNTTLLMNVYADLGNWWGLTPYVGAGIGVNYVYQKAGQNWFMSNGLPYQVTTPDAVNPAQIWYYNFDQQRSLSSMHLAWALMAGLAYTVTPNLTVDVGARYLHLGSLTSYTAFAGTTKKVNDAKEIRIGFRYFPD
jgi:opacity protein-like surface antigen